MMEEPCPNHHKQQPSFDIPSSYSSTSLSSYLPSDSESGPEPETDRHAEELRDMVLTGPLPTLFNRRKRLTKQLSLCETPRDRAWEKRRRQFQLNQERRKIGLEIETDATTGSLTELNITDEDLHELKGCIDLGFGFNEEDGQGLTNTLPALDLYFAVNRQFSPSPVSTPTGSSSSRRSSSFASPKSESDSWKICNPGDAPEQVKTKLRHWAQAVACSVKQSY